MAGVGRGKNYTEDELKQLCLSSLHISQDPAVGNGQRSERFWDRVQEHYNQRRPDGTEARGKKSLEGKWADIKHDVSKFVGCYQQVEERQTSGTNDDDTLKAAKELYKENHPKSKNFTYEGAWQILKDFPRWSTPIDDMPKQQGSKKSQGTRNAGKEKDSLSPSPEIISIDEGDNEEADDSTNISNGNRRPVGNKRAKEELKRARIQEDAFRMSAEAQKVQAAASKQMAQANYMRARTLENNSTIALLSLPTDTMEPELQAFMSQWKLEEAQKLKKRMQQPLDDPPAMEPARPVQHPPTVLPAMFPARPNEDHLPSVRRAQFPLPPRMANVEIGTTGTDLDEADVSEVGQYVPLQDHGEFQNGPEVSRVASTTLQDMLGDGNLEINGDQGQL